MGDGYTKDFFWPINICCFKIIKSFLNYKKLSAKPHENKVSMSPPDNPCGLPSPPPPRLLVNRSAFEHGRTFLKPLRGQTGNDIPHSQHLHSTLQFLKASNTVAYLILKGNGTYPRLESPFETNQPGLSPPVSWITECSSRGNTELGLSLALQPGQTCSQHTGWHVTDWWRPSFSHHYSSFNQVWWVLINK